MPGRRRFAVRSTSSSTSSSRTCRSLGSPTTRTRRCSALGSTWPQSRSSSSRGAAGQGGLHPLLLGEHGGPGPGLPRLHLPRQRGVERRPRRPSRSHRTAPMPAIAPYRQAGYSVWLDAKTGTYKTIPGAGRMNHENTVVVPGGWSGIVALTGDDTFNCACRRSCTCTARRTRAPSSRTSGSLWAFRVTSKNDGARRSEPVVQRCKRLSRHRAGRHHRPESSYPVPADYARGTHGGNPQTDLETWSNANNVFQFIRVEDIAYDPDDPRTVYFTDTGATVQPGATSGRMISGGTAQNGRVFKMVLNANNPKRGRLRSPCWRTEMSTGFTRPDNLAVGHGTLMLQEDASTTPNTNNDIWSYPLGGSGGPGPGSRR